MLNEKLSLKLSLPPPPPTPPPTLRRLPPLCTSLAHALEFPQNEKRKNEWD